jgi:CBS-domain-containing membrane protein
MPLICLDNGANRLESLRVRDVMSHEVSVIAASASMHQAAHILDASHTTGAPVVDSEGRCVGILSAADFVTFEIYRTGDEPRSYERLINSPPKGEYVPWNAVRRFMTTAVQTVSAEAPLLEAAGIMCAEHIHRLVVLNERSIPVGIITTLDVVAAMTQAADEEKQRRRAR